MVRIAQSISLDKASHPQSRGGDVEGEEEGVDPDSWFPCSNERHPTMELPGLSHPLAIITLAESSQDPGSWYYIFIIVDL